ncbi:ABC transporter ATP-binding protein [Serpentinicella alkaliphila]|uniref:Sulfonate transport system ATP-binding protein n=1 Tax=Serpentinicella alkaliphila TaxID=1734049 RepID=A0A4R2TPP9_9FIRM|nr:ABC transporter ATP-binding protein [Serpentinicella alkaliphila]QUH24524.1 ABC transporter ATP-binding protein [Serpentinicella alkaliphila]TCQ04612.1 sulfonate transport system ATP-binding protein [Serpentinicella alkaliphila]
MAGIKLSNLSKQFSIGAETIHALKNIDLHILDGSFTTIVGKSGCGKTTLLRLLSGLEKQSAGEIEFTFTNNDNRAEKRPVGIVFQESRLFPWLTVKENMAFPLFKLKNKLEIEKTVDKYLHIMGLKKFKDAYPSQISGGMAQRTAVGRTLCYNPDIILMDEPFAALDYFTRKNLQEEMVNIFLAQHKTIVFVTHNVEEAVYLGEKVIVFNEGEVVMERSVPLSYPRQSGVEFINIQEEILNAITGKQTQSLYTL